MITAKQLLSRGLRRALPSLVLILAGVAVPAGAQASPSAPALRVASLASVSNFVPGDQSGSILYVVTVTNVGGSPTDGSPITVTDTLPTGVSFDPDPVFAYGTNHLSLTREGQEVPAGSSCTTAPTVSCSAPAYVLQPGMRLQMPVAINIAPGVSGTAVNQVSVSGGGAPDDTASESTPFSSQPANFGFQSLDTSITRSDGSSETQAGGHPYQFHTGFQFDKAFAPERSNPPAETPKDVIATLPAGMIVNPNATPVLCTEAQLEVSSEGECPLGSAVGIVHPTLGVFGSANPDWSAPLFNIVPPPGVAAAFAFSPAGLGIFIHILGGVDSSGDFALTAATRDIPQYGVFSGLSIDLWGNPSDPSHDYQRGACGFSVDTLEACPTDYVSTALLTMPTACSDSPPTTTVSADSWEKQGIFVSGSSHTQDAEGNPVGISGCNALEFEPTVESKATTNLADSPTGLDFKIHQPQENNYEGLSTAALKDVKVTLPEGLVLNPSAGNGLAACSESQIGYQPSEGKIHFSEAPNSCPDAAKLGSLEVSTPLLKEKLPGSIYLAQPYENPFGNLTAIYLAIESPQRGIVVKLAGKVTPDPQTGRLTATFTENPQSADRRLRNSLLQRPPRGSHHAADLWHQGNDHDPGPLVDPRRSGRPSERLLPDPGSGRRRGQLPELRSRRSQQAVLHGRHRSPPGRHLLPPPPAPLEDRRHPAPYRDRHHPARGPDRQAGRHPLLLRGADRRGQEQGSAQRRRCRAGEPVLPHGL